MPRDEHQFELGPFARAAIRFFAPPEIAESFAGDLLEEARAREPEKPRAARRWVRTQIARAIPRLLWLRSMEGGARRGSLRLAAVVFLLAWRSFVNLHFGLWGGDAFANACLVTSQAAMAITLLLGRSGNAMSFAMFVHVDCILLSQSAWHNLQVFEPGGPAAVCFPLEFMWTFRWLNIRPVERSGTRRQNPV